MISDSCSCLNFNSVHPGCAPHISLRAHHLGTRHCVLDFLVFISPLPPSPPPPPFFGCPHSIWKLLGQGSNLSFTCNLRHSCWQLGILKPLHHKWNSISLYLLPPLKSSIAPAETFFNKLQIHSSKTPPTHFCEVYSQTLQS